MPNCLKNGDVRDQSELLLVRSVDERQQIGRTPAFRLLDLAVLVKDGNTVVELCEVRIGDGNERMTWCGGRREQSTERDPCQVNVGIDQLVTVCILQRGLVATGLETLGEVFQVFVQLLKTLAFFGVRLRGHEEFNFFAHLFELQTEVQTRLPQIETNGGLLPGAHESMDTVERIGDVKVISVVGVHTSSRFVDEKAIRRAVIAIFHKWLKKSTVSTTLFRNKKEKPMSIMFPQWVNDLKKSDTDRARLRLRYILAVAAVEATGKQSVRALARHSKVDHSTISISIRRGYFTEDTALLLTEVIKHPFITVANLTKPLEIKA